VLLASRACFDEAELRFVQAINLNPGHTEAMVNAAMCCAVRGEPAEALALLQRAQKLRPFDGRIGLLLAQAANATQQKGIAVRFQAAMPSDEPDDDLQGREELARVIEADPDFVDAFLSIPILESQQAVYATLLRTLECVLERQPEHAELHFHCGRVLDRLGRREDAIQRGERAVSLEPRFVRALIELAKLYRQSARPAEAVRRLEQAIQAGGRYPDVYYLLGQLYTEQGEIGRARTAYRRAVLLNDRYEAAHEALALLPAEK
jgi:predicted Zn-dependent protease